MRSPPISKPSLLRDKSNTLVSLITSIRYHHEIAFAERVARMLVRV
jgi:hypothetical protein